MIGYKFKVVKKKLRVFPEFVADFNLQVLIILNFLLFPDFVDKAKGIYTLGVIAFPSKRGGMRYAGIPFDSNCGTSTYSADQLILRNIYQKIS